MIGDFFTVIRYFVITILLVGVLQVEMKGKTLENHVTEWFYTSTIPQHIRTAAKGGAVVIETAANSTKRFLRDTFSSASAGADRASR